MQSCLCHKVELERLYEQSEGRSLQASLGDRDSRQGQLQSTLKKLQQALANAQADNDGILQVNLLKRIGLVHCKLEEYAWGIKRLEQALQIAKVIGNQANIGIILYYIGVAYRQTGQENKALRVYLQALAIFKITGDKAGIAHILNHLGEIYNNLGQSERSLLCCRQALEMFQDLGNSPDAESAALHNIGESYSLLGRHRQALAFFEQALAICQKVGNHTGEATALESIGTAYIQLDQEKRSLEFLSQALVIRRGNSKSSNAEARNLNYIGAVYYKMGNYPLALQYHLQALRILHALHYKGASKMFTDNTADNERFLYHLVAAYNCLNLRVQGGKCYQQALEIVRTFGVYASEEAIRNYFEKDSSELN